jgi:hypothetical protein
MANLKMVDLGAPPASMIPVQQDVESAGRVGRAVAGFGQQAMQITQQIYQRKQQQDESYANVRLQQVGKAYESAINGAATDDSLSADPEAAIKAANNVAFGDGKKLYDELKHLTMSDSQRREFNVRMATLQTAAVDKAHLITQQWDVKYKARVGQETFENMVSNGEMLSDAQKSQYYAVRADLSTDEKEIAWGKLLQLGTFSRTKLAINAAPTEQQAQLLGDAAFTDQTLTVDQRVAARDEATQQANKIRITADREQSEAARTSITDFSVAVAQGAQTETVSNWGTALMADAFDAESPLISDMPDKMKANVSAMDGDARRALGATMVGQAVKQAGKGGGVEAGTFIGYLDAVQKGEDMSQELNNPKLSAEQRGELMQAMAGQNAINQLSFDKLKDANGWEDVKPIMKRVLAGETLTKNQRMKFAGAVTNAVTLGHMKEAQAQTLVRLALDREALNTSITEVKEWAFDRKMSQAELDARVKGANEMLSVLNFASRNEAIQLLSDYYSAFDTIDWSKPDAKVKYGELYENLKTKASRVSAAATVIESATGDIFSGPLGIE